MARQAVAAPEFFGCRVTARAPEFRLGYLQKLCVFLILDHFVRRGTAGARVPTSHRYCRQAGSMVRVSLASSGATPERARSNDLTGRSTALPLALLCFGNSVNRK